MAKKYSNLLDVYHALWGALTKYYKNKMKNTSTTLEIPEGSKATIQGKVIDGKNYLVVEVEQEQEPELKEGDMAIFWDYTPREAIIAVYRGVIPGSYVDNSEEATIAIHKRYDDDNGLYFDHRGVCWFNALKWDGTREQYEKVLRGEL
jgi:hypothetical protein